MANRATTTESAVARAAQEVQAAMIIAKRFPRDYTGAFNRILEACKRKSLAEVAIYSYPRGGTAVSGPSIRLAECLAQNWGNVDFGIVELDQRNGESSVMAYCWDLETNTRQTKIFTVKHERRVGKGDNFKVNSLSDPRDIYEMVANNGARRLRACILGVIPGDVVDAAVAACEKTAEAQDPGRPLIDRVRELPRFFDRFGVTQAMLEAKLEHKLDITTSKEYAELLRIWNALKDNMAKVEDFFKTPVSRPEFTDQGEGTDLGPQTAEPANPAQSLQIPNIKLHLARGKHTEAELVDFLRTTGRVDDSMRSLEEIAMVKPSALDDVNANWPSIDAELKKLKAKK